MTTATIDDKSALLEAPEQPPSPPASMMVEVARKFGVSPIRQLREAMMLTMRPTRLRLDEYYSAGLYDPALSMEQKRQYIGVKSNWDLNEKLSPAELNGVQTFVANKVMYTALIRQLGFGTTETQAVVSNIRKFGNIRRLAGAEELRAFLTSEAKFPLFGKPQSYSGSFGSALIDGVEGEEIVLGNGRRIDLDAFCKEITSEYAEGYLLQSALKQHESLTKIAGRAIGTVRIVTIRPEIEPEVFYALWKVPSPDAMSDNFWQDGSMITQVDKDTGQVGLCRKGTGLKGDWIETHPVSGERFDSLQVPFWEKACEMSREAHALFPEFGVIGWDVAVTEDGPVLIECNDNPFHSLYQLAYQRGIRNPDFAPVLDKTMETSRRLLEEKNERISRRKKAQKSKKN